ncbi:hypothetical protein RCL_jg15249.t1 [Rhizophagus clarus]|uniref:Uncharacterized protein n=1 Tax=Rhizophagus clarus TaxID=94130 RepID=A0A8H3L1P0_9GLOM|nr:hypothetical protein RCL_jg15249.t1 [Rhizophagus clarus]
MISFQSFRFKFKKESNKTQVSSANTILRSNSSFYRFVKFYLIQMTNEPSLLRAVLGFSPYSIYYLFLIMYYTMMPCREKKSIE